MSLSAELKDFSNSFRSTTDMWTRYSREKDMAAYRKAKLADNTLPSGFGTEGAGGAGASGASGGAGGGVKLSQAEQTATAKKIYSSLLDKGYTSTAAAGITGNLWHESGGFGGDAGDAGSAHGIAQWRGDRWTKLQEYAKAKGKNPNDLETQVDYLDQELKTDYKSAYNLLQHASDVKTATGIFADQYERPAGSGKGNYGGISGMSNRLNFASQVAGFGGGAIGTGAGAGAAAISAITGGVKKAAAAPKAAPKATVPSQVASPPSDTMGALTPEAGVGQTTVADATGGSGSGAPPPVDVASADEDPEWNSTTIGAASGGMIRGYATGGAVEEPDFTGVEKGVDTNYNPAFRKSLLSLQQAATAAGIKTRLISGRRTLQDQKELYANMIAGKQGKPLPFPKRGAVKVAAVPGTSPHEDGRAADLIAENPKDQPRIDALAKKDPNLATVAGDPGHYQLNSGGKGGATDTMVASQGKVPPPPVPPQEEADDPAFAETADDGGGDQPEARDQGNAQGLADATERGKANQAYMASEQQYGHQRNLQESAANEQALNQEAVARSTPPPPQAQQEAEGAAAGGMIRRPLPADDEDPFVGGAERDDMNAANPPGPPRGARYPGDASNKFDKYEYERLNRAAIRGYAPGGVVDATGYIAPDTATLSASTRALLPAVTAATQATPAVPMAAAAPAAAPAPAPAPAAAAPAAARPSNVMEQAGYGDWSVFAPKISDDPQVQANYAYDLGLGGKTDYSSPGKSGGFNAMLPGSVQQQRTAAPPPIPPVKGTDRGSVWNPTTKSWEAGAGYTYDQASKSWKPGSKGYAGGGDVEDDTDDEAVPTTTAAAPAPAPAASAPAPAPTPAQPAQPTPTGDARNRAGAPGMTDPTAQPQPGQKPPPPPPNLVADALHDGLVHLTKMFGLDKVGAVQDPDAQARIQAFNNGAGAADGEAMHAVHRAVDPNNQMSQQELATASVAALKSYYDAKGQPEAGAKAIGEIMQHQKAVSAHFSATAQQAFQQGDVQNGLKFLRAAYDQVPDGQHIDAVVNPDNTVSYKLTDSSSGRVIHQGVANAKQLALLAHQGSSGTPYVKAVATTAARAKTPTTPTPPPRPPGFGEPAVSSEPINEDWKSQPYGGHSTNYGPPKDAAAPPDASQASAGGSGAYLAQREAALTSGVNSGAVDTGTQTAQADTVATDATVDGGPRVSVPTAKQRADSAAAIGGAAPAAAEPKVTVHDAGASPPPGPTGPQPGLLTPGNIDLAHRPIAKVGNDIATVNSIGIGVDGKQVLIPTVVNGKLVDEKTAIAHWKATGENLGTFDTTTNATQYARRLHMAQAEYYKNGQPPDEAVPTDGRKPKVEVPDTPLVTPEDHRVTPTVAPEREIPKELTTPVVSKPEKADQEDVPEVAPVTPRSVDEDYDLTPKTFDKPPPNPDTYFAQYNRTSAAYPVKNTAVRKALVTMYNQANTAYREADAAWKDEKSVFETEEGKRLQSENERAGRAQQRENTTSSEQFTIDQEKRKEVLTKNEKAQERADSEADKIAAQQAGLNKDEVARIVERNKEDRAAARAGDAEAQKRLDKSADDLVAQKRANDKQAHDEAIKQNQDADAANAKLDEEAAKRQQKIDDDYRAHNWDTDKEARALANKKEDDATIKPTTGDQQKAIDEELAAIPSAGGKPAADAKSALDELYSSFLDPDTGEKYTDPAKMKKDLGTSTVNGIRELTGHLIHANGFKADTAVDIAKQLINSDLDAPSEADNLTLGAGEGRGRTYFPGKVDREPQEFFKVAPKPDAAGNLIIKVPGYPTFKISSDMASSVLEMQKSLHEHSKNVRAAKGTRDALAASKSNTRWGTVDEAVDTGISGTRGAGNSIYQALFPKQSPLPTPIYQPPSKDRASPSFKLGPNGQIVPVDPKDITVTPTKPVPTKPTKPQPRSVPAFIMGPNNQVIPNPEYK